MNQVGPSLLVSVIVLPLLVFWAWMFREMLNNDYLLPPAKNYWTMAFIFCSILAAAYYYTSVYRHSQ